MEDNCTSNYRVTVKKGVTYSQTGCTHSFFRDLKKESKKKIDDLKAIISKQQHRVDVLSSINRKLEQENFELTKNADKYRIMR